MSTMQIRVGIDRAKNGFIINFGGVTSRANPYGEGGETHVAVSRKEVAHIVKRKTEEVMAEFVAEEVE